MARWGAVLLLLAWCAVSLTSGLHLSYQSAGNVFLQGDYITAGINKRGYFGTRSGPDAEGCPPGFYCAGAGVSIYYAGSLPFGSGTPPAGDVFNPGDPLERWTVGWGGTPIWSAYQAGLSEPADTVYSIADLSDSSAGILRAQTRQVSASSCLDITQTFSLADSETYVIIDISITNTCAFTLNDVRYMRNGDCDQDADPYGAYDTLNTITGQNPPGVGAGVSCQGPVSGVVLNIATGDPRAIAFYGSFSPSLYDTTVWGTIMPLGTSSNGDDAMSLQLPAGDLPAGQTISFSFGYGVGTFVIASRSPSRTSSETPTPSSTASRSVSGTASATSSETPTRSTTPSTSPTSGASLSASETMTVTPTSTVSVTPTASMTPSASVTPSASPSPTPTATPSQTPSASTSPSPSSSASPSPTPTMSATTTPLVLLAGATATTPSSGDGLSSGTLAALILGAILAALLCCILSGLLVWWARNRKRKRLEKAADVERQQFGEDDTTKPQAAAPGPKDKKKKAAVQKPVIANPPSLSSTPAPSKSASMSRSGSLSSTRSALSASTGTTADPSEASGTDLETAPTTALDAPTMSSNANFLGTKFAPRKPFAFLEETATTEDNTAMQDNILATNNFTTTTTTFTQEDGVWTQDPTTTDNIIADDPTLQTMSTNTGGKPKRRSYRGRRRRIVQAGGLPGIAGWKPVPPPARRVPLMAGSMSDIGVRRKTYIRKIRKRPRLQQLTTATTNDLSAAEMEGNETASQEESAVPATDGTGSDCSESTVPI